jgi:hypothetical protein
MSAHLSRLRLFQRHLRCLVWVWVWVWDWIHSHTPPRTRSPSSRHPPFTHYPFPPRSLVCGGQPSPHKPRLVVSHSTCSPLSSSPHAHSFVLGTAVVNTHTHRTNARSLSHFRVEDQPQCLLTKPEYGSQNVYYDLALKIERELKIQDSWLSRNEPFIRTLQIAGYKTTDMNSIGSAAWNFASSGLMCKLQRNTITGVELPQSRIRGTLGMIDWIARLLKKYVRVLVPATVPSPDIPLLLSHNIPLPRVR